MYASMCIEVTLYSKINRHTSLLQIVLFECIRWIYFLIPGMIVKQSQFINLSSDDIYPSINI
jgi:hypothetical protein